MNDMDSFNKWFKAWFTFCALMAFAVLVGGAYVVYLLLSHFQVI